MNHRKGDRYLAVKVYTYPIPVQRAGGVGYDDEHSYIFGRVQQTRVEALTEGRSLLGDGFAVVQIRDGQFIEWDGPGPDIPLEVHTARLEWVLQ